MSSAAAECLIEVSEVAVANVGVAAGDAAGGQVVSGGSAVVVKTTNVKRAGDAVCAAGLVKGGAAGAIAVSLGPAVILAATDGERASAEVVGGDAAAIGHVHRPEGDDASALREHAG